LHKKAIPSYGREIIPAKARKLLKINVPAVLFVLNAILDLVL